LKINRIKVQLFQTTGFGAVWVKPNNCSIIHNRFSLFILLITRQQSLSKSTTNRRYDAGPFLLRRQDHLDLNDLPGLPF